MNQFAIWQTSSDQSRLSHRGNSTQTGTPYHARPRLKALYLVICGTGGEPPILGFMPVVCQRHNYHHNFQTPFFSPRDIGANIYSYLPGYMTVTVTPGSRSIPGRTPRRCSSTTPIRLPTISRSCAATIRSASAATCSTGRATTPPPRAPTATGSSTAGRRAWAGRTSSSAA